MIHPIPAHRWGLVLSLCALVSSGVSAQSSDAECLWCHGHEAITRRSPEDLAAMVRVPGHRPVLRPAEQIAKLYVNENDLAQSAHRDVRCVDCHHVGEQPPHGQRLPSVVCGDCHQQAVDAVARGRHREVESPNGRRRPGCSDCHGRAHRIAQTAERTNASAIRWVERCSACHDSRDRSRATGPSPAASYRENTHGRALFRMGLPTAATCADCHGSHTMLPPSDPASPLHPLRVPETCGRCHEGVEEVYFSSVHGQHVLRGEANAAACTSCHSSHGIHAVDEPFLRSVVEECSDCHIELGRTYLTSYHGKATTLGGIRVPVCSSCHGAHDILPRSDPRSRVNPDHLVETCGKCHPGANENFASFITHVDHRDRKDYPAVYYTWLVMTTLLLSVLALFVPHSLLWFLRESIERLKRPLWRRPRPDGERWIERFRPVHRWTHFLIVVSFMGLVLTGFPLKYSYTDWAKSVADWLGGVDAMGVLHRIFAVLTFGYAGLHLCFLAWAWFKKPRKPRRPLRDLLFGPTSMVFSLRDLKDFASMMRWFFFLGPRPRFDRWTYLEKFDYWGEMWGIFVIGGTGLMLWMPTFFTSFLPGWILNCALVVHSIEALLAASVIFLVHFLNTHLRPDKFPVDMAMFTGQLSESEMKHERPREYERLVETGELEQRIVQRTQLKWRIVGAILGIAAFTLGICLIALAMTTELRHVLG